MSPAPKSATEPNCPSAGGDEQEEKNRCQFYLTSKRRFCANTPLPSSNFCGNHNPSTKSQRLPCPIDPSHSVLRENLDSHVKRCPLKKQAEALETKSYYSKRINGGAEVSVENKTGSEAKRRAVHELSVAEFEKLVEKIRAFHSSIKVELNESFVEPDSCKKWLKKQIDRQLPYQEKHVMQQVSILGNMEAFGILKKPLGTLSQEIRDCDDMGGEKGGAEAVVEFGAGRGYLTHMLADCFGMKKIFLVERRSYKLKADRSLRQDQSISLERLRIDIEDLDLDGIESLKGQRYLAIGKHLCGSATDLAIRCCLSDQHTSTKKVLSNSYLQGVALATCCHHLCQWNSYINTTFLSERGITKADFDAITWFSSWAVDADHNSDELPSMSNQGIQHNTREAKGSNLEENGVEKTIKSMQPRERAVLGFICKEIIDIGRLLWLKDHMLDAQLVKYVPCNISPENHLLVAKCRIQP